MDKNMIVGGEILKITQQEYWSRFTNKQLDNIYIMTPWDHPLTVWNIYIVII